MSENIREPIQQRSIDKKNRIIQAGYELFAEKGYFNTNTAEIAKRAGVSTGIVYGYFHDKRDILFEVLGIYIDNVFRPVFAMFDNLQKPLDFESILSRAVDSTVEMHKNNAAIHETLHSLTATDNEVNEKFLVLEKEMTERIATALSQQGYVKENMYERVHLTIGIVQSYAHECTYDNHSYIDYAKMRKIVIEMLIKLYN